VTRIAGATTGRARLERRVKEPSAVPVKAFPRRSFLLSRRVLRTGSLAGLLAVWYFFAWINQHVKFLNPLLVPTPRDVLLAGIGLRQQAPTDIETSLLRVAEGFCIGAGVAIPLGCLVGSIRALGVLIEPTLELLRQVPPLAFLPIFLIWFGFGEASKILMIAFSSFFPVFVNTLQGVRYADPILLRAALSLGAKRRHLFLGIRLPAATPQVITGLRQGMANAFFVLVTVELVAASSGMGYRIQEARWQFRIDRMLFGAAEIGLVGYALLTILRWSEERLLAWKERIEH
jgi:ABC-type nitrate/sulfonate/bicarbonate transport system permease component